MDAGSRRLSKGYMETRLYAHSYIADSVFRPFCYHILMLPFYGSELNCEANELSLGDEVEFSTTKKNGKINAERIIKIPNGSIHQEVGGCIFLITFLTKLFITYTHGYRRNQVNTSSYDVSKA